MRFPKKEQKQLERQQQDFTKLRDDQCIPIARELLLKLASRPDLAMGNGFTEEELKLHYDQIFAEIVSEVLIKYNVKVKEVRHIFQLMLQPVSLLSDVATLTMDVRRDQAESKLWGLSDKDDLRVLHITHTLAGLPLTKELDQYKPELPKA